MLTTSSSNLSICQPGFELEAKLRILLCSKIIVKKSTEGKTGYNVVEVSKKDVKKCLCLP
jgi:hypothetical protein